ncbi:cysteine and histidine-rich domain-containing protein RAR1-like [Dioscorea cayenensis subsp. rotundata]|uniref:Cysteine and histidine-rich domain-containing protein RAR1-like n=1 Tax=Dioscorea cayennensis subsp. rotundata TaxID=55577 RepID=A0AB40AVQ7_DIOCR|nr:cysteine and histidine-rich domain-containing protein RAR1-like [Dioscorea cayenensis subsp. rotundata]
MEKVGAVRCQRIGCDAFFTEEDNADGSCRYHDSGPIFHDGMKEWSCCKQRSHDFSLFLAIPGCKTGKHTTEKPVLNRQSPSPPKPIAPVSLTKKNNDTCSRCRQGFFCSDHGSQTKPSKPLLLPNSKDDSEKDKPAPVKKKIDLNEIQTCRNKGCGKTFKEKDNHETACEYHPGPPVFHDRIRGWKCCDMHVKEFDEFMNIPPCTKGWHNADPS